MCSLVINGIPHVAIAAWPLASFTCDIFAMAKPHDRTVAARAFR